MQYRDYQIEDAEFLAGSEYAMLAHQMRVGKTISVMAGIEKLNEFPVFIVASSSLLRSWKKEFEMWLPNIKVQPLFDSKTFEEDLEKEAEVYLLPITKLRQNSKHAYFSGLNREGTLIYNQNKENRILNEISPALIVVDECQSVINPKSQTTRALWAFRENAKRIWLISGTPLTNYVDDIWSYLRLFDRKKWSSRSAFREKYIDGYYDFHKNFVVNGFKSDSKNELFELLEPMMHRTSRSDLGSKTKMNLELIEVPLSAEQHEQYSFLEKNGYLKINGKVVQMESAASKHLRLRQLCSGTLSVEGDDLKLNVDLDSPKIQELEKVCADLGRAVILTYFTATAEAAAKALGCDLISGAATADAKAEYVEKFQSGETDFLVITYGAGGVGITLDSCDTMVRLERQYSLEKHLQAQDRIVKLDSKESYRYIDIYSRGTIDPEVGEKVGGKIMHIKEIIDYEN